MKQSKQGELCALIAAVVAPFLPLLDKTALSVAPQPSFLLLCHSICAILLLNLGFSRPTTSTSRDAADGVVGLPCLSLLFSPKRGHPSILPLACLSVLAHLSLLNALLDVSVVAVLVLSELVGPFAHVVSGPLLAGSPHSDSEHAPSVGWPWSVTALWGLLIGAGVFAAGDPSYSASGYAWLILHVTLAIICQRCAGGSARSTDDGSDAQVSPSHLVCARCVLSLPFAALLTAYSGMYLQIPVSMFAALTTPRAIAVMCFAAVCGGAMDVATIMLGQTAAYSAGSGGGLQTSSSSSSSSFSPRPLSRALALVAVSWLSEAFVQGSIGPASATGALLILCLSRGVPWGGYDASWSLFSPSVGPWRDSAKVRTRATAPDVTTDVKSRARLNHLAKRWESSKSGSLLSSASLFLLLTTVFCAWLWALPIVARESLQGLSGEFGYAEEWQPLDVAVGGGRRGAGAGAAAALWSKSSPPSAAILAKPVAMRAVVMTGGTRIGSLRRLLYSLALLINDGDRIDTDVWIDVPPATAPLTDSALASYSSVLAERRALKADIAQLGVNGTYRNGLIRAHVWDKHMGLRGQWLDAWDASLRAQGGGGGGGLTEDTVEIGLILEDDLELSPYAWRWLKAAHARFGAESRIAGFTLQRAQLCAAADCHRDLNGGPDGAGGAFLYPLIGTWGYSPTARSYARFRRWYYSLPPEFKPYVDGLLPTEWYKSFEKAGTEKVRMWEMHHLKYTDTHEGKYTVYVKCPENLTLAVNHRELGLNYHTKEESPHTMLIDWAPEIVRFSDDPLVLNYRAEVVGGKPMLQ